MCGRIYKMCSASENDFYRNYDLNNGAVGYANATIKAGHSATEICKVVSDDAIDKISRTFGQWVNTINKNLATLLFGNIKLKQRASNHQRVTIIDMNCTADTATLVAQKLAVQHLNTATKNCKQASARSTLIALEQAIMNLHNRATPSIHRLHQTIP